jgi:hypothetical protein
MYENLFVTSSIIYVVVSYNYVKKFSCRILFQSHLKGITIPIIILRAHWKKRITDLKSKNEIYCSNKPVQLI